MERTKRAEQLQRHLISVLWAEAGGSLVEATKSVGAINWAECGGFENSVESFFNGSEQAHLSALAHEEIALVMPWLTCDEMRAEAEIALQRLASSDKRVLLGAPCSLEYLSAPPH